MLSPYYPVMKFFTIKSVIFLSFWQGEVYVGAFVLLRQIPSVVDDVFYCVAKQNGK